MHNNSRIIHSSQVSIHRNLEQIVRKHTVTEYRRPIPDFSCEVFSDIQAAALSSKKSHIILDSCCGTGESTRCFAYQNHDAFVIGVDKSLHRIQKHKNHSVGTPALGVCPNNYGIWRADVEDVWQLIAHSQDSSEFHIIPFSKHYLLFPNPYPKPSHVLRRWHGHPLFATMLRLASETELRTNWRIYAEEFAMAATILGYTVEIAPYIPDIPVSAFERKYAASGHQLYRVCVC